MTAYAQSTAQALYRNPFGELQVKATQADNGGDVILMGNGMLGVVQTLGGGNDAIASGDPLVVRQVGVFDLISHATSDTYTDGYAVYWDTVANVAYPTLANGNCVYAGTCVGGKLAGASRVTTNLNGGQAAALTGAATATTLAVSSTSTLTGNVSMGGTLAVTGAATLSGGATLAATLKSSVNATPYTATASTFTALGSTYDVMAVAGVTSHATYGVKLPAGVAGQVITLIETAALPLMLYPATGGTSSGLSANTPVTIAASHIVRCYCTAANTWFVEDCGAALAA